MEKQKKLKTLAMLAAAVLGAWLGLWLLGPVLLPFAVGLVFAKGAQPAIAALERVKVPRWVGAGLCVSGIYALLLTGIYALCRILCREAVGLARQRIRHAYPASPTAWGRRSPRG